MQHEKMTILLVLAPVLLFMSAASAGASDAALFSGQKIVVSGTGDSQELLRDLAGVLMGKLGGGIIEVPESIGSGGGLRALAAGKADLARVARPLMEKEKGPGLTYDLFALSPIVFVVHPSVADIDGLDTEQILEIYSGRAIRWEDLGARSGKIYPVIREAGDSCLTVIQERLPGFREIDRPAAKVCYTTPEAVETLAAHKNTLGFLPASAAMGTGLKILKVNGVYPSPENVRSGKYALAIPLALVYRGTPVGLTKAFVDFLHDPAAERIITEYGALQVR